MKGTPLFISIELATGSALHTAAHDLKSIFHVMLYAAIFWILPGQKISKHKWARILSGPFSPLTQRNPLSTTGTIRAAAFRDKDTLGKTLNYMTDYFQPLQPLMMALCLKVFDVAEDKILTFFVSSITHESFKEASFHGIWQI